jgi:elongation factor G
MCMQTYEPGHIRNVALMGHSKSGKTSLTESILLAAGVINRAGRVEDGNTVADFDEQEHLQGHSINTSFLAVEWDGHRLNLLDTPGYADFEGQVISAAMGADTAVITVDGAAGIEAGTESAWDHARHGGVPAAMFAVTRLDREHASFSAVVDALRARFGDHVAPIAIPDAGLSTVVSLLDEAPPPGMEDAFTAAREMLLEAAADFDDELLTHYLDGQPIDHEELANVVRAAVAGGGLIPVVPLAATAGLGVTAFMDLLTEIAPGPLGRRYPLADGDDLEVTPDGALVAQVFSTSSDPFVGHLSLVKVLRGTITHGDRLQNCVRDHEERAPHLYLLRGREQIEVPVLCAGDLGAIPKLMHTGTGDVLVAPGAPAVAMPPVPYPEPTFRSAIHLVRRDDIDKMTQALAHVVEQDPTVRIAREAGTGETILLTQGEVHAEIVKARLEREYGVAIELTVPLVPYLETVRGTVKSEYRHKKQTGGRGQFGHVVIEVEPLTRGEGFQFQEKIVGGTVPKQYIPAVQAGIEESLPTGPLTHSPLVDLRVTLLDGSSHSVDSSEMAFKLAAQQALAKAVLEAQPALLEPLMRLRIRVPSEAMGDISGVVTSSRGSVLGFEPDGDVTVVEAVAPLAEVQRFGPQLRSLTHGRGRFTMEFDHHAEVPRAIQEQVIANRGIVAPTA